MKIKRTSLFTLLLILIALFSLSACGAGADTAVEIQSNISVEKAADMIEDGVFILDVRTPEEWNQAHISGSALIPHDRITEFLDQVPTDQDVLIYCRSGNRSSQVLSILLNEGFTNVFNMLGGMNEWTAAGYPVEK